MAISNELMRAILAMDAYNRGYKPGIEFPSTGPASTQLGNAMLVENPNQTGWEAASFFAQAYTLGGKTIISYRGTDSLFGSFFGPNGDLRSYPLALGNYNVEQARLAAQFYLGIAQTAGISASGRARSTA
jgi:hypothetical protein